MNFATSIISETTVILVFVENQRDLLELIAFMSKINKYVLLLTVDLFDVVVNINEQSVPFYF